MLLNSSVIIVKIKLIIKHSNLATQNLTHLSAILLYIHYLEAREHEKSKQI